MPILLIMLLLAACGKSQGDSPLNRLGKGSSAPAADPATATDIEVHESLEPIDSTPGHYRFKLEWRGGENYSDLSVTKRLENEPADRGQNFSEFYFSDADVQSGQVIEYKITGRWEGGLYLLYQNKVQIPEDLVIAGDQTLTRSFRSPRGRLFLEKNAVLRTAGNDIKIEVDGVVSGEGATLQTAPLVDAPMNAAGMAGGKVWLRARSLAGALRILSQGQSGGRGHRGGQGAAGAPGRNGKNADSRCLSGNPEGASEAGAAGEMGGAGAPGGDGGKGGNSAQVKIEIFEAPAENVVVEHFPGAGGPGGDGGAGGVGGEGGRGGNRYGGHGPTICDTQTNGPRGGDGPSGAPGLRGAGGEVAPDCILEGGSKRGQCDKLTEDFFQHF